MMPYYVGIDGGGTKTAVELRTRGSAAHSRAVFGPLNCNSDRTAAAKTLTDTLAWLAAQPEGLAGCDGLCIGSAGISNPDAYNFIQDIIRAGGYTGPLQIVGDQVTALAGALGQPVGTVLIAGTGSICYARTADGREARSGGWGSLMDDEGGGFALGRDALAAVVRAEDGRWHDGRTGERGDELKKRLRTGTVLTYDDRNWELRYSASALRFNLSRAVAIDMESATIAAQGYRFRVPYGTLLCVSDKPLHGEIKLPGQANRFYEGAISEHLQIGIRAIDLLRAEGDKLHSRKLRTFNEPPFR